MHVVDPPRKAVSPDDAPVKGIYELDSDDKASVRDFNRAPQAVTHAEQSPDVAELRI